MKMSKIARVMQIVSLLMSVSLSTLDQIEEILRKDKSLTKSQKESLFDKYLF